jgi:putative LysE/RhtB family amino acid efflux pump
MPSLAALYARTFVIGIAVAAPVGAMGVLCIQRTLKRGWRAGIATGLGIATADGTYAALAAFGVAAVSATLVAMQSPLRIAGGLVLVWLGWQAIIAPPQHEAAAGSTTAEGFGALYTSAVALTLTNPMTIMAFAAVFASAGLGSLDGWGSALVATLGVASGSLVWWVALTTGVSAVRHTVSDRGMVLVNRISGAVIVGFGVIATLAGLAPLISR